VLRICAYFKSYCFCTVKNECFLLAVPPTELSLDVDEMTAGSPAHLDCKVKGARHGLSYATRHRIGVSSLKQTIIIVAFFLAINKVRCM
jgi:hypothetical protein